MREGKGYVQKPTEVPGPKASLGAPRTKGVLHTLRRQASNLGPNLLRLSCSPILGVERLDCGVGPVGVPERKEEWWGGVAGTQPSPGTVSRSLSESSLHPGPTTPPQLQPLLLGKGRKPQGLGAGSFLEAPKAPFHPHPKAAALCSGGQAFLLVGGMRRPSVGAGQGAPRLSHGHRSLGTCLTSVEGCLCV